MAHGYQNRPIGRVRSPAPVSLLAEEARRLTARLFECRFETHAPPAIFCLRISIALSTAVGSSACTSGGIPRLLYLAPLVPPITSSTTTDRSPPASRRVSGGASRRARVFWDS